MSLLSVANKKFGFARTAWPVRQGARDSLNQRVSAILTSVLVRDAVDVIAWDVFERAVKTRQPITLAMIERRIDKSNDDKPARGKGDTTCEFGRMTLPAYGGAHAILGVAGSE